MAAHRLVAMFFLLYAAWGCAAQTFDTHYERPIGEVFKAIEHHFGIRLKCSDVDTAGLRLPYADFRIRPYSLNETLQNVLSPFDFKAVRQNDVLYKVKPYEYARRTPDDGRKLTCYLASLYDGRAVWEQRCAVLRSDVRRLLGIDTLLSRLSAEPAHEGRLRWHNGYTTHNFRLATIDGRHTYGTVYVPTSRQPKEGRPLIVCPNGHFANGRYGKEQQMRLATLARMGAICVSYDLWGWGESAGEVGGSAHRTDTAHVMQALNGLRITRWLMERYRIDSQRVGLNGGSGGGTQVVLLSVLSDIYTAACPVVSVSSWFDGGCPCESGRPIQLAGGGTCNAELMAAFAPRPLLLVSDGNDWTSTTPDIELPFMRRIYGFYGAEKKVENIHLPDEKHDFGSNKRQAVYAFFANVFGLDISRADEKKVDIESEEDMKSTK